MTSDESKSQKNSQHSEEFSDVSEKYAAQKPNYRIHSVCDRIEIYWPLDSSFYAGKATEITNEGKHVVTYDNDDVETLNILDESWRFISYEIIHTNTAELELRFYEPMVLKPQLPTFGNEPFKSHHAQGLQQHALLIVYKREEDVFADTVKCVPRRLVPNAANIISSHVLYKTNVNDDSSLSLKAPIAPHGTKDSIKADM